MKFRFSVLVILIFLHVNISSADLEIIIKSDQNWGEFSDADVKYLCENIADHFEKHLRPENEINSKVNVYRTTIGHSFLNLDIDDPHVKYKIGVQIREDPEIIMRHFWNFIIRFGHEFTHILQIEQKGVSFRAGTNPNLWFTETIAEMGCVWVLKNMADTWIHGSRFGTGLASRGGFAEFSENFDFYADWYMGLHPYSGTGKEWLEENEDSFRDEFKRTRKANMDIIRQLYPKFLPIFEDNPEAWNAVRKMPVTNTEKMPKYMQAWYDAVDVQDKIHVSKMADVMGISISDTIIAQTDDIDADIDNNGYIDLSDVLIVRSAIQNRTNYDTDVNNDGTTDELDVLLVKAKAHEAIAAAAPSITVRKRKLTTWGTL